MKATTTLRVYTHLNVTVPGAVRAAFGASQGAPQVRLLIIAANRTAAVELVRDRGIRFRENLVGGPVRTGPATISLTAAGLMREAAVYAYPMPWGAQDRLVRVDADGPVRSKRILDTLPHVRPVR